MVYSSFFELRGFSMPTSPHHSFNLSAITLAIASTVCMQGALADSVTDWNFYTGLATKGGTSSSTGTASNAVNSNVATRIAAIEARAVFDAVNSVNHFSPNSYYYNTPAGSGASAAAAAIAAAHDVLVGTLTAAATITWLNNQRDSDLTALGVTTSDAGYIAGQAAAAAALAARAGDPPLANGYIPSTNISGTGSANATGNPGRGLWRPSNGAAGVVSTDTGAPTGFDVSGNILPAAGINFNFKNVTPFSLSVLKKQQQVAAVPPSLKLSNDATSEYQKELKFVHDHGQEFSAASTSRTSDQLLQALYPKLFETGIKP
jgi:hypothetical protein